jgi:hypothetical protein
MELHVCNFQCVFFVKDKFLVLLFILDSFKNLVKCITF